MNLKNAIDDYLKNRFINYALLIKGEWGSGKTFFVKKNVYVLLKITIFN